MVVSLVGLRKQATTVRGYLQTCAVGLAFAPKTAGCPHFLDVISTKAGICLRRLARQVAQEIRAAAHRREALKSWYSQMHRVVFLKIRKRVVPKGEGKQPTIPPIARHSHIFLPLRVAFARLRGYSNETIAMSSRRLSAACAERGHQGWRRNLVGRSPQSTSGVPFWGNILGYHFGVAFWGTIFGYHFGVGAPPIIVLF